MTSSGDESIATRRHDTSPQDVAPQQDSQGVASPQDPEDVAPHQDDDDAGPSPGQGGTAPGRAHAAGRPVRGAASYAGDSAAPPLAPLGRDDGAVPGRRGADGLPGDGVPADRRGDDGDLPDRRGDDGDLPGWRAAAEAALYGPEGFYLRPEGPAGHFRTSVHASGLFAEAVARLLCRVDEALGAPDELAFVDMGAGRGELVTSVLSALPAAVASRARGYAVERAVPHLETTGTGDGRVTWLTAPPHHVTGLLFANEWLDNIPLDIVETDSCGVPRHVLVRQDGTEVLGPPLGPGPDARWLDQWWPLPARPGLRAEVGRTRDAAWAAVVGSVSAGLAVAADYMHLRASRPPYGTLSGFRAGRQVPPVPNGSCDITAHVALDACARAGTGSDGPAPRLTTQREALRALGVCGQRPPVSLASVDPAGYVRRLARASEAAELTAPGGFGDFGWLLQPVGVAVDL